jgi:ATP/ADP translocase
MDHVRSLLNLKRGEEVPVGLLFLYLTLALTAYTVTKSVRDSLFLVRFSALKLPYGYTGVAVITALVVAVYVRLSSRLKQGALVSGTLLFFVGNVLLLWWAVRLQWSPIAGILYL